MTSFNELWLSSRPSSPSLDTSSCFSSQPTDADSPIDTFIARRREFVLLSTPSRISRFPSLPGIALVGVVAAVESYLRSIIRKTVLVDKSSEHESWNRNVSYGAALHVNGDLLPEVFLEQYSFVTPKAIKKALSDCLAIAALTKELEATIEQYDRVCQLRHCIVHRSGRLGSVNATQLGFNEHHRFIECGLELTFDRLHEAIEVCDNLVKSINQVLFLRLMQRVCSETPPPFCWNFHKDRVLFCKYFALYRCKSEPSSIVEPFAAYDIIRATFKKRDG